MHYKIYKDEYFKRPNNMLHISFSLKMKNITNVPYFLDHKTDLGFRGGK